MKKMSEMNQITQKDLYNLTEKEIIEKIEKCEEKNIAKNFDFWRNATIINESDTEVIGKYCVSIMNPKIRYIDPLVKVKDKFNRISKISEVASQEIEKAKKFKTKKYAYLDFTF